jgi:HK97 family phage prohead protease
MGALHLRGYAVRAAGAAGSPIRFVASTENVARDGLVIESTAWDLGPYERSPVVLWSHDYRGERPPIGRAERVWVEDRCLMADLVFDQGDPFARDIERKYREGFLNAVSVGWDTKAIAPGTGGAPPRVTKAELLDISAVPVPGDADALKAARTRYLALSPATSIADDLDGLRAGLGRLAAAAGAPRGEVAGAEAALRSIRDNLAAVQLQGRVQDLEASLSPEAIRGRTRRAFLRALEGQVPA